MEYVKKNILVIIVCLVPLFIITGPFLADFFLSLSGLFLLFYIGKNNLKKFFLNKYSIFFGIWIVYLLFTSILSEDVLILFCLAFQVNAKVGVVGANISPVSTIQMEDYFWRDQNIIRILESKVYTSSLVVAPCYAFRSSLLDQFPKDCVADDVYISFKANTENFFTKYITDAQGKEMRTPKNLGEFFVHKFRKGNAYLIELFRFFYLLPHMTGWWKTIYLTKFFQLAIMPWAIPFFLLSTISLTLSGWGLFQLSFFGLFALLLAFMATFLLLKRERKKYYTGGESLQLPNLNLFILSNIILIVVGLSYPFYKQNSSYNKIGSDNS